MEGESDMVNFTQCGGAEVPAQGCTLSVQDNATLAMVVSTVIGHSRSFTAKG